MSSQPHPRWIHEMLEVPVPCESGATALLVLPPDGLEADDALRMAAFVAAWALEGSE